MVHRLLGLLTTGLMLVLSPLSRAHASGPLVLSDPALSATHIAFAHAGQIWSVPREGGRASRIVTGQSANSHPVYSPDGKWIAFDSAPEGNAHVYVVGAGGRNSATVDGGFFEGDHA